jgi:hypothetical protein
MNTVQHKRKVVTRHEIHMDGPITARDISDFIHQVNSIYVDVTGKNQLSDDAYYVTGDEGGLTATFETKDKL